MNSSENLLELSVIGAIPTIQQPQAPPETPNLEKIAYASSWNAFCLDPENDGSANTPMHPFGAMELAQYLDSTDEHNLQLSRMRPSGDTPGELSPNSLMHLAQELSLIAEGDLHLYGSEPLEMVGTPPSFDAMDLLEHPDSTAGNGLLPYGFQPSETVDIPSDPSTFSQEMDLTEFLDLITGNDLQLCGWGSSETIGTPDPLPPLEPYLQSPNDIILAAPVLQVLEPCRESTVGDQRPVTDLRPTAASTSAPSPPAGLLGNGLSDGVSLNVEDTLGTTGDAFGVADKAGPNPGLSSTSDGLSMKGCTTAGRRLGQLPRPYNTSARPTKSNRRRGPDSGVRRAKQRRQRKDLRAGLLIMKFIVNLDEGPKEYNWKRAWRHGDEEEAKTAGLIAFLRSSPQRVQIHGKPAWGYEVVFRWNEASAHFEGHGDGDPDVYSYSVSSIEEYMLQLERRGRGSATAVQEQRNSS
ncbi:hypothetical protein VTI74DRAFT_5263 [Chaetomium olivicolor]